MNESIFRPRLDKSEGDKDKPSSSSLQNQESDSARDELLENMLEKHGKFLEQYAGDASIKIKSHKELPLNEQGTFAIDLKNGDLYAAMDIFKEKGFKDDAQMFAFLHEYEHFRELRELMKYKNKVTGKTGQEIWNEHHEELKRSKGLQILDNCLDDIKMNRTVLSRAPVYGETKNELYKNFAFPDNDLTKSPLHLQLAYALLRRRMLPENNTVVDPRVEEIIQELENTKLGGQSVIDILSSPTINMANRLELQNNLIKPSFLKLMEEARKEKQQQQNSNGKGGGTSENGELGDKQEGGNGTPTEDEVFGEDYADYDNKNPRGITVDVADKAVEKYIESENEGKSLEERQMEALAKKEGLSVEDIRDYQSFWAGIEGIENPETNERVVDELRALFKKIVTRRMPPRKKLKYNLEDGSNIDDHVSVVVGSKTGHFETKIWEDMVKKETSYKMVGNFDVTLVCDRSGSMQGEKSLQQRIAVGLFLEMLKEFSLDLEEAQLEEDKKLYIRTEVWGFGSEQEVGIIKPMNEELSEKDRVTVYKALGTTPGNSTLDYRPLQEISKNLDEGTLENIREGKQRKIVVVITDGVSDSVQTLKKELEKLRTAGVHVVGIGVGNDAESIKNNYQPSGVLCRNPNELGKITADLLKEFVEKL